MMILPAPSSDFRSAVLSRNAQIGLKIFMAIFSPLLILGVLEGYSYFWEMKQAKSLYAWELVASRRVELTYYTTPGAGYTLMKPGRNYLWHDIPVQINLHGLRSPELTYKKAKDVLRILYLGDSVVMGWGVREEETCGQQLQQLLNQSKHTPYDYQVINAGVPGWNLENEFAYLLAEGLKYEPDLIVWEITIPNDIYGSSALNRTNPPFIEWMRAHTYSWPFLAIQLDHLRARWAGRENIDVLDPPDTPEYYFPLDPNASEWGKIQELIIEINQTAKSYGIPLILILFPIEYQVINTDYVELPQKILSDIALQNDISVVDLLPAYRKACQEKSTNHCQLRDRYLFADTWMHPSPLGHKIAANEILAALIGYLP
jgi:lysophospholipase L1-like esterase